MVAIDPSAAFKKAITTCLPAAEIAVGPFHPIHLANQYPARVLLRSAHRARQHNLTSQGTTVNCEWPRKPSTAKGPYHVFHTSPVGAADE